MSHNNDPRATPFRRHRTEPNRGTPAGPDRDTFFSPPPSPRPEYADVTSASSGYGDCTPASSDWNDESTADEDSDPEPCHEPTKPTNESHRGSDGAGTMGGDDTSHPGSDTTNGQSVGDDTATCGRPGELEYRQKYDAQIEAWVSDLERRAAQNTNVFLRDGITPNPARAPYVSLRVDGESSQGSWHSDGPEPFWKWSILLQRWIHEDAATGMLLIYPKQLIH